MDVTATNHSSNQDDNVTVSQVTASPLGHQHIATAAEGDGSRCHQQCPLATLLGIDPAALGSPQHA